MNRTKGLQLEENKDQDYWFHNQWEESYDSGCRISHREPTGILTSWDARRSGALLPSRRQPTYSRHLDPRSRHITEAVLRGLFKRLSQLELVISSRTSFASRLKKVLGLQDTIAMVFWLYLFGRRSERGQPAYRRFLQKSEQTKGFLRCISSYNTIIMHSLI